MLEDLQSYIEHQRPERSENRAHVSLQQLEESLSGSSPCGAGGSGVTAADVRHPTVGTVGSREVCIAMSQLLSQIPPPAINDPSSGSLHASLVHSVRPLTVLRLLSQDVGRTLNDFSSLLFILFFFSLCYFCDNKPL